MFWSPTTTFRWILFFGHSAKLETFFQHKNIRKKSVSFLGLAYLVLIISTICISRFVYHTDLCIFFLFPWSVNNKCCYSWMLSIFILEKMFLTLKGNSFKWIGYPNAREEKKRKSYEWGLKRCTSQPASKKKEKKIDDHSLILSSICVSLPLFPHHHHFSLLLKIHLFQNVLQHFARPNKLSRLLVFYMYVCVCVWITFCHFNSFFTCHHHHHHYSRFLFFSFVGSYTC